MVGFATKLKAGPFAGNPLLSALPALRQGEQPRTGEDAESHHASPLGLAAELGQLREFSRREEEMSTQNYGRLLT